MVSRAAAAAVVLVLCAGCGSHAATTPARGTSADPSSGTVVAGAALLRRVWTKLPSECRDYLTDPSVPASERARRAANLAKVVDAANDPRSVRCVTLQTGP